MDIPFSDEELVDVSAIGKEDPGSTFAYDPNVRLGYFKSLGNVKKVKMNGQSLIKDSDEMQGRRNSLDGYEMYIIPEKEVAILEKLYETTRDDKGNVVYATNRNQQEMPAIECETYFMPLEMARDFWEAQNKRDLLRGPSVEKAYHTSNWSINAGLKIERIASMRNFDREAILSQDEQPEKDDGMEK